MLDVNKEQIRRMVMEEIHFLRAVAWYRKPDHECNEDMTEVTLTDMNTTMKIYQQKLLEHLESMSEK